MPDPYAQSVHIDSVMGNFAGAMLDLMSLAQEAQIRAQLAHALKFKEAEIRRIMPRKAKPAPAPKGPTIGPATASGVFCVIWINQSTYPDPAGGYVRYFKRLDVIGAYHSFYVGKYDFEHMARIDSVESGYTSMPQYLWLEP